MAGYVRITDRGPNPNEIVTCACGCGARFPAFGPDGARRSYVRGHNRSVPTGTEKPRRPLADRFWEKVDKNGPVHPVLGTACWLWFGATRNGYGAINDPTGGVLYTHRLSWEFANGPVPEGLCTLHKCDVRRCVNPDHLFLGTKLDNMRDMASKGRRVKAWTYSKAAR